MHIIDRRPNSGGKNLSNRQRFIKRAKKQIKDQLNKNILKRSITSDKKEDISIPSDGIEEHNFHHDPSSGKTDKVLPGNKEFSIGDLIEKPKKGGGKGGGKNSSDSGEGEDDFLFSITGEEYDAILFEDLELPRMVKKSSKKTESFKMVRAGYTNVGNPSNIDYEKTLKNSLSRRICLKNPKFKKIKELEEELSILNLKDRKTKKDKERIEELEEEIRVLKSRANNISYIDDMDLRYKNYVKHPNPKHQAVMFALMDVSGSMGQYEKELAKRFYMLLYRFLKMHYKKIDIVYIRHHVVAKEVDEEEFFYSKESGGTIVSSGFKLMNNIIEERYPEEDWNIYCAETSDGDNFASDMYKLTSVLLQSIMPRCQFLYYVQVGDERFNKKSTSMWDVYTRHIMPVTNNLKMIQVFSPQDIYPTFRELFKKEK